MDPSNYKWGKEIYFGSKLWGTILFLDCLLFHCLNIVLALFNFLFLFSLSFSFSVMIIFLLY